MGAYIRDAHNSQLDFVAIPSRSEFVSVRLGSRISGPSIDFWDMKSGRIKSHIVPPNTIQSYQLQTSPDSRLLIAALPRLDPMGPRLLVWSLRTRKLLRDIPLGPHLDLTGAPAFVPGRADEVLVPVRYETGHRSLQDASRSPRVFRVNLSSGSIHKNVRNRLSPYIFGFSGQAVFSPDKRLLASVSPTGEGDTGDIDVVDTASGRRLCHFQGDFTQHPIQGAAFFLPGRRLFFNSTFYNEPNSTTYGGFAFRIPRAPTRSNLQPKPYRLMNLRCVSGFPSRPGCGFFVSDRGLELWNIPRHKMLRRWPGLEYTEQIFFSPDGKTAGFYFSRPEQDDTGDTIRKPGSGTLQFWRFH